MSNFIYDNTSLPATKSDRNPLPVGENPTKWVMSADWNALAQALIDIQSFCRGANWFGMTPQSSEPSPVGVSDFLWIRTSDGALMHNATPVGGTTGTPLVAIAKANSPGSLNVSTEGTIDWLAQNIGITTPFGANPNTHTKLQGGWLFTTGSWVGGSLTTYNQATTMTVTSTVGDDRAASNQALAAVTGAAGLGQGASVVSGFGWYFRMPAKSTQRVFREYISVNNCTVTITASLSKSGTTQTTTDVIGAVQTERKYTITYTGGDPDDELIVTVVATTNAGSGNLCFAAATLALV